jgi:hypothetical protein
MIDAPWFQGAVEQVEGRKSCWKLRVFYVKPRASAEPQKNGLAFCQPVSAAGPRSVAFVPFRFSLRTGSAFTRTIVFLVERSRASSGSMILSPRRRPMIVRPHVVVRLSTPIIAGIFVWHWPLEISILRTVHLPRIVLRASHFAVHSSIVCTVIHPTVRAIIDSTIYPVVHSAICTVIDTMIGYRSRFNSIVSAEFSGA